MTIADRQHAATVSRLAVAVAPPAPRWLAVRWDVCDGDLRGVLEWRILDDLGSNGHCNGAARRGAASSAVAVAIWQHESAPTGTVVATVAAADAKAIVRSREAGGLEHLDIPGLLALTVHRDAAGTGAATVLYARTPVLANLGARGGRTDCPSGAVIHTAHDNTVVAHKSP